MERTSEEREREEDVNKTVYAITLKLTGANGGETKELTRDIQFKKMDATAPTPETPLVRQDISSTCYSVYNYINVIDMLNYCNARIDS